jgi:ubiquinone/menaquinone biosynthesis C-methylase UbiE
MMESPNFASCLLLYLNEKSILEDLNNSKSDFEQVLSWKYTDEYYKEYTRTTWNESADIYVRLMELLQPYGVELLNRIKVNPRESVLDIGTGPGEPAMTISQLVGASGHITGIDLSEKMVELAKERSRSRKLSNLTFQVMDAEKLSFPDNTFDVALSRFGFQIFTDPEKAAKESYRVLKPDGRFGVIVWSTGDKVPFLHVLVGPMLEFATPDETGYLPTPYELGGSGEMAAFLGKIGFRDIREEIIQEIMRFRDEDEYLEIMLKGTPIGHSLLEEDQNVRKEVLLKTRKNLEKWKSANGIELPSECVLVTAKK